MQPPTARRRELWIALAIIILLVIVSWTVVAIVDGVTHPSDSSVVPTRIERTRTP